MVATSATDSRLHEDWTGPLTVQNLFPCNAGRVCGGIEGMYHHLESTKKEFIGKSVESVARESDSAAVLRFTDGAGLRVTVEGDCCSHSIFYEIVFPNTAKGSPIADILERPDDDPGQDSEETALVKVKASGIEFSPEENNVWDVIFRTAGGDIRLRHINASNGYYDGMTEYESIPAGADPA